jgi:prephenate dehydrogenase
VCSVQARPQAEVEAAGVPLDRFLGSHPVAGRELSGPGYADPDLFDGRPWVLCPTASTAASATTSVQALATAVGAQVSTMPAAAHDRLFARLSHLPQLVASALAGTLGGLDAAAVALAGAGLRDTTRLADSTPQLWAQIVGANRDPVATSLDELLARLHELRDQLDRSDADAAEAVAALVRDGRAGRAKLPGKHGGPALAVTAVRVVIPDRPGALADLFGAVAAAEVNLEDIRLEHSPGAATGIAELIVRPDDGGALLAALREGGWTSTSGTAGRL